MPETIQPGEEQVHPEKNEQPTESKDRDTKRAETEKEDRTIDSLEGIVTDPISFDFETVPQIDTQLHSELVVELAEKAMAGNDESRSTLLNNLENFHNLNSEAALALINLHFEDKGKSAIRAVAVNLEHFSDLNDEVARRLLKGGIYHEFSRGGLDFFDNNLSNEVAEMLVKGKCELAVMRGKDHFPGVDREFWIAMKHKGYIDPGLNPWIEEELGYSLRD